MKEMPVSQRCKEILEKREHALIGISPFNSYFSEENIKKLIYWGYTNFKNFHLLIPDTLPCFNFLAIGYSDSKALNKTKRQIQYLLNKVNRAFSNLSLNITNSNKLVMISKFSKNHVYHELYDSCLKKYVNETDFKQRCFSASELVLKNYTINIIPSMLDMSSKYLLGELPFYINTPKILGIDSSLLVYHENIEFFVDLYKNRDKNLVDNNQGHLILKLNTV